MRERLAALAHDQWSGWMEYLFSKCTHNVDGTVTIPAWAVDRWKRQMRTPYRDLLPDEQDSDRAEADKFLAAALEHIRRLPLRVPVGRCSCGGELTGVWAGAVDYLPVDVRCESCGRKDRVDERH